MKEVVYEYKGKKYRIFAESKSKINGEWVDSIIYQSFQVRNIKSANNESARNYESNNR